jgi:L-ornithine N5-oxygenase
MKIGRIDSSIHDVVAVGFGPSNIALAVAHEESGSRLDLHFVEQASETNWQPTMLLDGSDIQNNPLRDLVTPRNPKSHYTFVNYLKCESRLFEYLNLGVHYPLRKDYARYVRWVSKFFEHNVTYGAGASDVTFDPRAGRWVVDTDKGRFEAAALVVGTGRSWNIPEIFAPHLGPRVFHLSSYLDRLAALGKSLKSIAVVGGSQSAVEILLDLIARDRQLEIHSIHRSFAMRQKDTSPFSDRVYFPEFVDYFFNVDQAARSELQRQLRPTNYNSADIDVLHKLYLTLYEERLDERPRVRIHNNAYATKVRADERGVTLRLRERFLGREEDVPVDAVVLATGFKDLGTGEGTELFPPLLSNVADGLARRPDGALDVRRDYSVISATGRPIYLNGMCESSHGLGDAGSFSLLSLRSMDILTSLERALGQDSRPEGGIAASLDWHGLSPKLDAPRMKVRIGPDCT